MAYQASGSSEECLRRKTASDQGKRVPASDVAAAPRFTPTDCTLDLLAENVPLNTRILHVR